MFADPATAGPAGQTVVRISGPSLGDRDGVLEVGGQRAVAR